MDRRKFPSLKRYLAKLAESLQRLREISFDIGGDELSSFEQMVILLEDRRFFRHHGFDWRSVLRETLRAMSFRRHGGASTIEMQYVRTVTGDYRRTLSRKVTEMVLSVLLDFHVDKLAILRTYLRMAYFGTGITGADNAASSMFGKRQDDLSLEEAAILASLLVYPRPRQPSVAWDARVKRRASYGLRLWQRLHESLQNPSV